MMIKFINRKWFKNIKFSVLALITIGASLFCALHDFSNDFRHYPNTVVHPIGWTGVAFFGYALIFMIYKNTKYALQGRGMVAITDKGLFVRDEFVAWENIAGITGNERFVIIDTNDTKERLLRASWWTKMNYKIVGAMVTVSNFDYDGSQEEFMAILKQHIELHEKRKQELSTSRTTIPRRATTGSI